MAERSLRFDLMARDKTFSKVLDQAGRKGQRLNREFARALGGAGDNAGRQFSTRFHKRLGGGFSVATGLARKSAGLIGAAFAVAGVAQFAKDSVTAAATFDKTMRQVATVAKLPTSAIKDLRNVALDMGAKTSFSASQASEAMLALAKGGLTAAQIKAGGLKSTLTLAAAGGLELGEAANFVVKSLGQFGLKVDKAADVAAALAGGANASTASVQDLGEALAQVGPGARNAGLSLQETVAVLGAFSDNGIRGSDAGTSLKTMLVSLVPTTDKAARTMRKLGLDFTDAHGAIIPVTQIAQQLHDRLGKLSQAQRIAALQTIFGSDATRAATVLMQEGAGGLAKYIKATNDRGAAEKLAKENTKGASGAFERLSGAIETVQIQIGDAFLPLLADAAEWLAKALPAALDKLQHALADVRQWWEDNRTSIELIGKALSTSFSPAADGAAGSTDRLSSASMQLSDTLDSVLEGVARLSQGWNWLVIAASETAAIVGDLVIGFGYAVNAVDKLSGGTGKAAQGMVDFGRGLKGSALAAQDLAFASVDKATEAIDRLRTGTGGATSAAQSHATALSAEKAAIDALRGTLDKERDAELNLRQAKLNVSTAQTRLNDLKKAGRTRSTEYKQAQLNLERAQLALSEATADFRGAVNKSNEAERLAASRAAAARAALDTLRLASVGARKRLVQFALDSSAAIQKLRNKTLKVTANYNIGAPKGIELLIEKGLVRRATGGPIAGPGTATSDSVPAWLSTGEHVWSAKEVQGAGGHKAMERMRQQARGMAAGGPVLKFDQTGTRAFLARPGQFDANIARSLTAAARGFAQLVRQNKESIFGVGKAAVKRFIQSTDALNYGWGGAGPNVYDCSGIVGAAHLAHLGRPYGHGQRLYTTGTIRAGVAGLKPGLGGTLQIGVTAGTGHMAGRYGGLGFEARSTRSGIIVGSGARAPSSFARQFHLARGGRIDPAAVAALAGLPGVDIGGDPDRLRILKGPKVGVFDQGGWLMPDQIGINRSSKPERILPPGQGGRITRAEARMIAEELAKVIPTTVAVDDVHAGLKAKKGRHGGMKLGLA